MSFFHVVISLLSGFKAAKQSIDLFAQKNRQWLLNHCPLFDSPLHFAMIRFFFPLFHGLAFLWRKSVRKLLIKRGAFTT